MAERVPLNEKYMLTIRAAAAWTILKTSETDENTGLIKINDCMEDWFLVKSFEGKSMNQS